MQTKNCEYTFGSLNGRGRVSTGNVAHVARERMWEVQMATLEAIHTEIRPQLDALRELDEEHVLGFLPTY